MASEPRTGETAAARIAIHTARPTSLKDEDLLGAIRGTEPFREAEIIDSAWDDPALWDRLGLMLAFADEIGRRGLIDGIAPLYDLAPLDDPWEMTQGIRHGPERATKDQPGVLESIMRELVGHPRGGTRLWATRELGILRDAESLGVLRSTALEDPEPLVREEAVGSLLLLTQARGRLKRGITSFIYSVAKNDRDEGVRRAAVHALGDLDEALAAPLRPAPPEWFMDPGWPGQTSGPEAYQAIRRIVRALIGGELRDERLDATLATKGLVLAMTPGGGVYPPAEPPKPADGSVPTWRAKVQLWGTRAAGDAREPLGLTALIELRRASRDEVRAELLEVVPSPS